MTQYSRVPEFILEEKSGETSRLSDHLKTLSPISLDQALEKLKHLSVGVHMCITTLEEIQDLLHDLEQLELEPE